MSTAENPALVLNADFRPLSYYPLSLCSWQDAIKAVFLERVSVIENYEHEVHSPNLTFKLPSVIALKDYVTPQRRPAFTRFNVFLRDNFTCQYCTNRFPANELTFDHLVPKCLNGKTTWENVVSACTSCNLKKGRKYAIVLTFLVAAFLTPPDLISQIGLAIPTLLLYELSILLVSLIEKENNE